MQARQLGPTVFLPLSYPFPFLPFLFPLLSRSSIPHHAELAQKLNERALAKRVGYAGMEGQCWVLGTEDSNPAFLMKKQRGNES